MKRNIIKVLLLVFMICLTSCANNKPENEAVSEETQSITEETTQTREEESVLVFDEPEEIKAPDKRYIVSRIRIRADASTKADIVGYAEEEEIYEVFENKKDNKYTWYRIGDNKWIADDGTWTSPVKTIKLKSNNGTKEEHILEYLPERDFLRGDGETLDQFWFKFPDYIFVGWNTKPDGTGDLVLHGEPFKNVMKTDVNGICMYAQWEPVINRNIYVKANKNIELYKGPGIIRDFLQATIKEGDRFEIYEQINNDGKIWNRVAKNLWFMESENDYSVINSLPDIDINLLSFDNPIKSVENWGDISTLTTVFNYNGDKLVSISRSSTDPHIKKETIDYFLNGLGYYYGSAVNTKYDSNGNISKQSYTNNYGTYNIIYEYDLNNRMISRETINASGGSDKEIYEYYSDGRLKRHYYDPSKRNDGYVFGSEFEYNGNLAFEYSIGFYLGKEKDTPSYFYYFRRFDDDGRLIQKGWHESTQAPWDICEYYYE